MVLRSGAGVMSPDRMVNVDGYHSYCRLTRPIPHNHTNSPMSFLRPLGSDNPPRSNQVRWIDSDKRVHSSEGRHLYPTYSPFRKPAYA